MPGKYLRGAFIQMMPTILVPLPNVILFQFNPETMTHTWEPSAPNATGTGQQANPLAVQALPKESFSFTLMLDSDDTIADMNSNPVAAASGGIAIATGLHSRLSALEMLLYPSGSFSGDKLLGTVSSAASSAASSLIGGGSAKKKANVPQLTMPTVLFVWGPYRIVPVRVKTLTITEKLYDPLFLNPTHAEAQVGLEVLTPSEVVALKDSLKKVAVVAYDYTLAFRQAQALLNLTNGVDSIIGMLPIG
jgi:hypothetical protein